MGEMLPVGLASEGGVAGGSGVAGGYDLWPVVCRRGCAVGMEVCSAGAGPVGRVFEASLAERSVSMDVPGSGCSRARALSGVGLAPRGSLALGFSVAVLPPGIDAGGSPGEVLGLVCAS